MAKPSLKDAIKKLEETKLIVAAEAEKIELYGQCPPLEKMDNSLGALKSCKHLALSTNSIDKIAGLAGMDNLQILSLGRNLLRKIEGLEPVSATLEELWLSYNQIASLTGLEKCAKLRILYLSNNQISNWPEMDRLKDLASLEEVLLVGCPLYNKYKDAGTIAEYRVEMIKRLPQLKKIDGIPIDVDEREAAGVK